MERLKHSITLYGFGMSYLAGKMTLEDILRKARDIGADGIEIVAPQMVPGHPNPSDDWIARFKDLCRKYSLNPVCYSIYVDSGKHKGRFLTEEERFAETIHEMETAKRMGFQIVRSQDALLPATMEKLLPYVEELELHLAIELHSPWYPACPLFMEYYNMFERHNSDALGVVMDFSAFTSGAQETVFHLIPDELCHKDILNRINRLYCSTEIPEEELEQMILDMGGDELDVDLARKKLWSAKPGMKMGGGYYRTKPDYDGFRRLLKYSKYMHGKFYYCNEDLECVGIDYPGFVKIMKEEGYSGYIASEYEDGIHAPDILEEDQIRRHIKMLDKLWAQS